MRHFNFIALLTLFATANSLGQCDVCTPDLTCSSPDGMPAFCPAQIPDAVEGVPYSQQITFFLPDTIDFNGTDVALEEIIVTAVNGLPDGIDVFFPNNDTTFLPSQGENYACVTLCGQALFSGAYSVEIVIDGTVNFLFVPVAFPTQNYPFVFNVLGLGCTDPLACNYDSTATVSDSSCGPHVGSICDDSLVTTINDVISSDCACSGTVIVAGCTNALACNYDAAANVDDGSCGALLGASCDDSLATTMNDSINSACNCSGIFIVAGCTDPGACNYDATANVDNGSCGAAIGSPCDDSDPNTFDDSITAECICVGATEIPGCTDFLSCNFNQDATIDDGSCLGFFGSPCDDGDSSTINDQVNFDCTCLGSPIIEGCTDPVACNYDAAANVDNGSCGAAIGSPCDDSDPNTSNDAITAGCGCEGVTGIPGCTDFLACNFNPQATIDDGSCGAAIGSPCDDGDATTANDITLPGCDCMGIPALAGCTNPLACNYNPLAVTDDGSCGPPTGEPCDDGDTSTDNDVITIGCLCLGNPLEIQDVYARKTNLHIYPNPAGQYLWIDVPVEFAFRYRLVNMTGQMVLTGNNEKRIDVSYLSEGLYFLSVDIPQGNYTQLIEILR
jgi:hypothetical protein